MELCHQNAIRGREDRQCRTQCHQNIIGGRAMPTPIIRILLAGGRTPKSNTVPSEYYWRERNADTNHQNTISGREDRESRTHCHQNTIGGGAMPTPVIRILLADGRTTNVEHSAIRIVLAAGRTTQVEHFAIRILLAGGGTTTVERNTIRILLAGGRRTNVEHSAIRILFAGGRTVGHPVWDLQSY